MSKNKLRKFAEMEQFSCVYQYPFGRVRQEGFPLKGRWGAEVFGNDNPIVLELGCGKGEYTVGLARECPGKNFIGIDIKGARMYTGAKIAQDQGLANAAFLRTSIELLPEFFAPGEVSEIWITFPDPQMKKVNKRLTGTHFLGLYQQVLADGGLVRLKTDSPFLYAYTRAMLQASGLQPQADTADLYAMAEIEPDAPEPGQADNADGAPVSARELRFGPRLSQQQLAALRPVLPIPNMRTHYEQQWLERGLTIKYLAFALPQAAPLAEPEIDIEPDPYRSSSRRSGNCASAQQNCDF